MPLEACPDCGNQVSTLAESCPHCGRPTKPAKPERDLEDEYDLPRRKPATQTITPEFLTILGVLLFLGGIAAAVYYYGYFDTTVASPSVEVFGQTIGGGRVHNIGLMQERQLGLGISIVATLVGLVALIFAQRGKVNRGGQ
jgi:rRNA maturation protein Nop10